MSGIVADAGPLIALAKSGLLELPRRAFAQTLVSRAVFDECLVQVKAADAQCIRDAAESGVLVVCDDPAWPAGSPVPRLDAGELSAIALALERASPLLIDEQRGRRAAARLGIPVVGVCGLLVIAKRQGWVANVGEVLSAMKKGGYYISSALTQKTLALAGE